VPRVDTRAGISIGIATAVAVVALAGCAARRDSHGSPSSRPASSAAQPPPAPPPAPEPVRRLTIEVNGDLLIHSPIFDRARRLAGGTGYDFAPMLRRVRPLIRRADVAFCHVETPMTAGAPTGYPLFSTPTALARAIRRTGWDACDTASNHSLDRGQAGIDSTVRALRRAGVRHTGSYTSARNRRRLLIVKRHGVKVALLAYTATTNGLPLPHRWSLNLARPRRILRDARRARRAGAQVVLVNLHWGTEYQQEPDALQRSLARRLARSRLITAVVGQHVHVVQPIRRVAGRWVVFGEGNLLSNETAACCPVEAQDGMLVFLHLRVQGRRAKVTHIDYVPTWVRHPDFAVLPVGRALRRGEADRAELRASWQRTVRAVGRSSRVRPIPRRIAR
jgi:poly-gamma-glutamate capsule biosynthesis protein CapA/YwtB (metallophosphatase superfamily)